MVSGEGAAGRSCRAAAYADRQLAQSTRIVRVSLHFFVQPLKEDFEVIQAVQDLIKPLGRWIQPWIPGFNNQTYCPSQMMPSIDNLGLRFQQVPLQFASAHRRGITLPQDAIVVRHRVRSGARASVLSMEPEDRRVR